MTDRKGEETRPRGTERRATAISEKTGQVQIADRRQGAESGGRGAEPGGRSAESVGRSAAPGAGSAGHWGRREEAVGAEPGGRSAEPVGAGPGGRSAEPSGRSAEPRGRSAEPGGGTAGRRTRSSGPGARPMGAVGKTAGAMGKTAGTVGKTAGTMGKTAGTGGKTAGAVGKTAGAVVRTAGAGKKSAEAAGRTAVPRENGAQAVRGRTARERRSRGRHMSFPLILLALVIGLSAGFGAGWLRWGYKKPYTVDLKAVEVPKWVKQDFIRKNIFSRPDVSLKRVDNIVIHYVANPGKSAMQNRNYFDGLADQDPNAPGQSASAHFIVGLEGEVIQCIPVSEMAYAAAPRNYDTISIETCHPDATGAYTTATYNSLVKLTASLCVQLKLNENDLLRHYDINGKNCPKYFVENEAAWKQFKKDVKAAIKNKSWLEPPAAAGDTGGTTAGNTDGTVADGMAGTAAGNSAPDMPGNPVATTSENTSGTKE